jgi:flavin-dependent dehydrogenase
LGDAAGLITPLCGNGMSMALHSAKIASGYTHQFLMGTITRDVMEKKYAQEWKKNFATRLWFGRTIQLFFGKSSTSNLFVAMMKKLPWLTRWLIKQTHGKAF